MLQAVNADEAEHKQTWTGRAADLYEAHRRSIMVHTDRMFTPLLILHYLVGVGLAFWLTPRTWIGETSQLHIHLLFAVFLNLALVAPAVAMTLFRPGAMLTRHTTAAVLMLQSAMLIHLTGGRIETHFHVFASLALLAFYRDWRPLITATVVVAVDHSVRGVWYPQSVYGIVAASPFRWIEHAAWVLLEVSFLIYACHRSKQEMQEIANRQARLEDEIGRRQEMHEAMRTHAERLRLATSAGSLGLWDWQVHADEVYFSDEYYQMIGYEPNAFDATFEAWQGLMHPDDKDRAVESVERHFAGKTSRHDVEVRLRHQDGRWHWVRAVGEVVERDSDGRPLRMVGLHIDIDPEKRISEALAEARDAAEAASLAKSEFLANMSHEIRTPINGVIGSLELMDAAQLTERQTRYIEAARTSADVLLNLVNDILDFSKIEAQQFELSSEPFNLETMIEESMAVLTQRAQLKNLELAFSIGPEVNHAVVGDEGRLRQILVNLVNNGIKFTERGEVVVAVALEEDPGDGQLVRFEVRDTGTGIPKSKRDRLFKSFSQADSSMSRKYGGTGLGLVISKQLCEMMGGGISFDSIENLGSVFTFTVRLARQERTCTTTTARVLPEQLEAQHILVIDDNATTRQMLHELIRQWQLEAMVASDAAEAWTLLERQLDNKPITLALVDMVMPDEDGLALCQRIRRNERFKDLKLLLCNSRNDPPSSEALAEAGCNGIINKPIGPSRLFDAMIRIVMGAATQSTPRRTIETPRPETRSTQRAAGVRVLVAEDNEINSMVANDLLASEGFDVCVVENGCQAVEAVTDQAFDIVLMDCQMPEMDGFEATRRIRELHQAGQVHKLPIIIALTANALRGDREQCLAHGMDDYLSKPIQRQKLLATLEQWIGPGRTSGDAQPPTVPATSPAAAPEVAEAEDEPTGDPIPADPPLDHAMDMTIDLPELLRRCLNKVSLAKRVLNTFETTSRDEVEALGGFFAAGELASARITAHKIKGGAAQISAIRISELAGELEEFSVHPADDAWQAQMESLKSEVDQLLGSFPQIMSRLDDLGQATLVFSAGQDESANREAQVRL
ncbi:MAG: response regulator [Phycisphaeraceae bacterium]